MVMETPIIIGPPSSTSQPPKKAWEEAVPKNSPKKILTQLL